MDKIFLATICIGFICLEYAVYAHDIHGVLVAIVDVLVGILGLKLDGWRIRK